MMGLGNVGGLGRLGYAAANSVGWWLSGAQLDLDFANDRSFNRKTGYQASPNGLLTYTSPSPKMVYGTDGVLRYAPHNLILNSETLSAGTWTKARSTVSGSKIIAASVAGTHLVTAGGVFSADTEISIVAQAAELQNIIIQTSGGTLNPGRFYTLSGAGSIGGAYNSSGLATYSITSLGDGQYRCVFKPNETFTSINILVAQGSDISTSTNYSWTGDDVSGVLLLKAWAYRAPNHDSTYIPTTTAAVYSLPIDHNPTTFAPLGVLIEEQRTNLLTRSETFDTGWTRTFSTITVDQIAAPNGTTTADLLTAAASLNDHVLFFTSGVTLSAAAFTQSFYLKAGTHSRVVVSIATASRALGAGVPVDLSAGTIGTPINYGAHTGATAAIQSVGNGWYRVTVTVTGTAAVYFSAVWMTDAAYAYTWTPAGTETIYVWGAQLEAGAFATSYIPAVASQVTRAADQVSLATSAFNFVDATGTCVVELDTNFDVAAYARDIVRFIDGSNDYVRSYAYPSRAGLSIVDSSVVQCDISVGSGRATGVPFSLACAWADNDMAAVVNGGTVGVDTSGTMPTGMTTVRIGFSAANTNVLSGHIKRLTYWNTRKPNAELQVLSA